METIYYAIFEAESDGGYVVSFPDVEDCYTQGDTFEEAYKMAIDALAITIGANPDLKFKPSSFAELQRSLQEGRLVPIPLDRKLVDGYAPKKRVNCSFRVEKLESMDAARGKKERSRFIEDACDYYIEHIKEPA